MGVKEKEFGPRGQAFWSWVYAPEQDFDPTEAEVQLLREVCRAMDVIDDLAAAVESYGTMVLGSKGQPTLNPAIPELRQAQAALARLIGRLNIDDEDEAALKKAKQLTSHAAAQAAWRERKKAVRA